MGEKAMYLLHHRVSQAEVYELLLVFHLDSTTGQLIVKIERAKTTTINNIASNGIL